MGIGLVGLASGVIDRSDVVGTIRAAAEGGFDAVGVWFDPASWSAAREREVTAALADTGLVALDMEALYIGGSDGRSDDHGEAMVDAALAIGASNVLCVGPGVGPGPFAERFGELADRAAAGSTGRAPLTLSVEPTKLFSIALLTDAVDVMERSARPNTGILLDNLHIARMGLDPSVASQLDPAWIRYAQVCDAPAQPRGWSPTELRADAVDDRCNLGEGDLDVVAFVDSLPPDTPCNLEILSSALRELDPVPRARSVREACRRTLGV